MRRSSACRSAWPAIWGSAWSATSWSYTACPSNAHGSEMTGPRKIFVKTFGCQMNVYDSERMTELLGADGFAETTAIEDADVVLLNPCHIREKAAEKVYSDLGRIRLVKDARTSAGQATIIAVAGCVAQAE